jgi:hypothetical protein
MVIDERNEVSRCKYFVVDVAYSKIYYLCKPCNDLCKFLKVIDSEQNITTDYKNCPLYKYLQRINYNDKASGE